MTEKKEMRELIGALHILAGTAYLALIYRDKAITEEYLRLSQEFDSLLRGMATKLSIDEMLYLREKTVEWMPSEEQ